MAEFAERARKPRKYFAGVDELQPQRSKVVNEWIDSALAEISAFSSFSTACCA